MSEFKLAKVVTRKTFHIQHNPLDNLIPVKAVFFCFNYKQVKML